MEAQNETAILEFLLLGLSNDPDVEPILFGLLLSMYLITVLGNLLIILAITSDPHLHTPMYFFLSILSLADLGFISTTVPKMLVDLRNHSKSISYAGCLTQVSFFFFSGGLDSALLAVMAYDRLVAICHPLHYSLIMSLRLCGLLVLLSCFISFLDFQAHLLLVSQLTFCKRGEIRHFFCDPSELLNLACKDPSTNHILLYLFGVFFGSGPISVILYSYIRIISAIRGVQSPSGKYKAFSTCGSHLSVVSLFYGTGLGAYFSSIVSHTPRNVMVTSLGYTVVTPMLNPFIYSLRNRDIKRAIWWLACKPAHRQCPGSPF